MSKSKKQLNQGIKKLTTKQPYPVQILMAGVVLTLIVGLGIWLMYTDDPTQQRVNNTEAEEQIISDPAVNATEVALTATGFNPATIQVTSGSIVTWTNADSKPHRIKADSLATLDSEEPLNQNDQLSFTFERPGTYTYWADDNQTMKGTVIVQ